MMQGDDWKKSFYKGDHKQDLLKLVRVFFQSGKRKWHLQRHLVTNSRDRTWKITKKNTAEDTDIPILILYGRGQILKDMSWYIKISANDYVDIDTVYQNFGSEICRLL